MRKPDPHRAAHRERDAENTGDGIPVSAVTKMATAVRGEAARESGKEGECD